MPPDYPPKIRCGLPAVDRSWGGLVRGGSYLVHGRPGSGHDLVAPVFLLGGREAGDRNLRIGPERPGGASDGRIVLPARPLPGGEAADPARLLREMAAIARRHRPDRLVLSDFEAYLPARLDDAFRAAFVDLLERLDALHATVLIELAVDAETREEAAAFMSSQTTGAVGIERLEGADAASTERRVTLAPHAGSVRRRVIAYWDAADALAAREPSRPRKAKVRELIRPIRLGGPARDSGAPSASRPVRLGGDPAPRDPQERQEPRDAGEASTPSASRPRGWSHRPTYLRAPASPPAEAAPAPAAAEKPLELTTEPAGPTVLSDRDAFRSRVQLHFLRRDVSRTPFVVIALRLDHEAGVEVGPFDFEFLIDLAAEPLRRQDALYVDHDRERLVAVLAERRADEAEAFFAGLRARLDEDAPHKTRDLLQAVSTVVIPDGQPFEYAEECLAFVLGEE